MSSDRDLIDVRRYLENGDYDETLTKAQKREVRRRAAKFFIGDGVLFYRDASGEGRTVIEQDSERIRILKACHEGLGVSKQALALGGHFGRDKTSKKISERYFWKGIRSDVEDFVSFTALLMSHAIVYILIHLKSPCICVFQPRSISHSLELYSTRL